MNKNHWMAVCGLMTSLSLPAAEVRWPDIRDGSLYLTPSRADSLQVNWRPAWQADGNPEQIYLLDGKGRLTAQRAIAAREADGQLSWPLPASQNAYQVVIPGYSFRHYRLAFSDTTAALFAPVKVHFSLEVLRQTRLYFRVGPNEQALLAGKHHGGIDALRATRLDDGKRLDLPLTRQRAYWQFDQLALPVSATEQVWQLDLQGQGKAAFWLDGTANLFARRIEDLNGLRQAPGTVTLRSSDKVLGPTPKIGNNLPYVLPPDSSFQVLDQLGLQTAGFYSFADVMVRRPQHENAFRKLYRERFGLQHDLTLLGSTNRAEVLHKDNTSEAGLDAWLATSVSLGGQGTHYLAFADEPNLNYSNYLDYRTFFKAMLERVERYPGAREAGVRIAAPASSRFVGGPLASNSAERNGLAWSRQLLAEFGERIDALAWHEWMVRDLMATRTYRDAVRQAAALVGLDAQGRPRKPLLIDQTNISSGATLSLYEQNTHYAALWWASVVVNAAQDGLLEAINWFHVADEPDYPKGMVKVQGSDAFELKPVGLAQVFIHRHWLDQVLQLDNDAFEVDALAMARADQRSLLGVNKAQRLQQVSFTSATPDCPQGPQALTLFGPDNQPRSAAYDCQQGRFRFEVPAQTLFALSWRAS